MKILCLSEVMPYSKVAHAGGKVIYNHLLKLSGYIDIDLLCYCDKGEEIHREELDTFCKNVNIVERGSLKIHTVKNSMFQVKKFSIALVDKCISLGYPVNINLYKNILERLITNNHYDLVELSFTSSLLYLPLIKKIDPNIRINIIEHDVSFLNLERNYKMQSGRLSKFISLLRLKVYKDSEIKLLRLCNMITVLNDKDRELLIHEGFDNKDIFTEAPYFDRPDIDIENSKIEKIKNSLLFYGAMWRKENDESIYNFLINIFPEILRLKPDVKLYIVGNRPTERIKKFQDNKNVFVTGFVEDPSQYFLQSEICVIPLILGAGIKIKTLEALSYGLPIVSTLMGTEGIDVHGKNVCIEVNKLKNFAEQVISLMDNPNLRKGLSENALKFIEKNYDLDVTIKKLVEKYKTML